ncbi:InlB B-repeat-containing protein [Urinicoccus massiliensis]|uniref:InlB B-repeat-containing protein n=1 Tax=Urinicoccus massiliensis TaxID=1723382 RepID=UPI0009315866|nr:InlB B-repeat-containing protein [Urinicoccus massiliensis]
MKKKRERPIAMLLAIMMLVMNLIVSPVWAAPGDVAINETNFPDETFREYVKTKFDTDKNGILSQEELNDVTSIEVRDKGITTLQGIEYFTGLMGLDCSKNKLTALNLSKNTKLSSIYCEKNQLESLDLSHNKDLGVIICRQNKLKTLDLTYNTELRRLLCSINQLTNLDLSTNSKLTEIDCASNKLKTLDLTNKTNLEELYCDQNQLTTLELTNDTKLKILSCRYNQLTTLDLTNKTNLEKLYCDSNQLTTLDLTNKTNLETLHCRDNQLATLDLSTNPKLKEINCEKNKLSELDLSHNTNLETLDCSDNQLKTLNLDTNTKLSHLYCHSNQLAALDLNDNIDSISFYGPYQKIYVSLPVDSTSLDLATLADNFDSEKVSDLKGQTITGTTLSLDGQPKEVFYKYKVSTNRELWVTLKIIYGEAFKVTFDRNKGLGYMDPLSLKAGSSYELPTCYFTPPEGKVFDKWEVNGTKYDAGDSITVNGDMTIKAIWKVFEEIAILEINEDTFPDANFRKYVSEKIDTSGNGTLSQEELDAVTAINVENKEITDLKGVEHFTELTKLNCNNNKLTTLNLTNNTKLENLSCLHNKLKSLDLSQNTNLKSLDCKQNQLTALNLTNNTKLIRLYCSYNDLTTLDLSKNKNLGTLYCNHNKLTNLDLSQNTNLTWINCQDNQLTNLDLSNNSKVKRFDGSGQVYDIKVSGSTLKFDLKSLPGKFDSSMASDWVGGKVDTVDSNILNLNNDPKPTEVKYNYKVNNGDKNIDVTLKVKYGNFVTITFDANGHGTAPADITVNKGEQATAPAEPTDANYDFGGWYKEAECTNAFNFSQVVNDNITLYAKWTKKTPPTPVTVTITFDANGHGTAPADITVNKGEQATAPAEPTDANYDFGGWYKEAECTNAFNFSQVVNDNITLYAKWTKKTPPTPVTVTITFDANGHGTAPADITVNKGEQATAPAEPTDANYDFGGWYKEAECTNAFNFSQVVNDNITLYAKWTKKTPPTPVTVTITFDANGHGTAPTPLTVNKGEQATAPAEPTDANYDFGGWYKEAECTNAFNFSQVVNDNITLYAKWTKKTPPTPVTVTITFDANGHGTAPTPLTVNKGEQATAPAEPTDANYDFGGWYTEAECTNAFNFSQAVNDNITLYAKWTKKTPPTPVTVTITFDANGHGTAPADITVNKGEQATAPAEPTDANYDFGGWYTEAECTNAFNFSQAVNDNITLYAKWTKKTPPTPVTVTITFDKNGGSGTMADVIKTKDESYTLPACGFTPPAGKEFKAWQVDGTEKNVGDKIVLNGDKNIKAVWKDIGSLPPTPYTPYPWTVYPGWYYNFEPPKAKEEKPATKMEMDWKIELAIGIGTIDRKINGADSKIKMDVAPYIKDGRTMLPIRSVAEALGFEVEWNKSTRTVVLKDNTTRVEIPVDTNKIIVNGTVYTSDVKPEIKNNRTMLPIANIARALGLKDGKDIIWNSKSKTVTIYRSILVK